MGDKIKKKKVRADRTTKQQLIHQLRRHVWLCSSERCAAVKRESNTCERCGVKGSKAKGREIAIQVHHKHNAIDWDKILDAIFETLLVAPEFLEVLCKKCHGEHDHDPDAWMK